MDVILNVNCEDCGIEIEIDSVSLFRPAEKAYREELYSYGYRCECGCAIVIDGVSGNEIPDKLKIRARSFKKSGNIKSKIDLERRRLPGNSAKRILKANRLQRPRQIKDDIWLVYDISLFGKIYYDNTSATYCIVNKNRNSFEFSDIVGVIQRMQKIGM